MHGSRIKHVLALPVLLLFELSASLYPVTSVQQPAAAASFKIPISRSVCLFDRHNGDRNKPPR